MRIPFDSLSLACILHEMQQVVGARVQRIAQPGETEIVMGLYGAGREYWLLLSYDPVFARMHFVTKRPRNPVASGFLEALRARLENAHLKSARQVRFDRMVEMDFEGAEGPHTLMVELMGKHSNLMLVQNGRLVSVAKPVPPSKSARPLLGGRPYEPPPFPPKPPIWEARPGEDPKAFEGASPFLLKWIEANGGDASSLGPVVREGRYQPVLSPGHGAYPLSVAHLGLAEFPRESLSIALEQHFSVAVATHRLEVQRASLRSQLERVLLAREVALSELEQSVEAASKAPVSQRMGELILAYAHQVSVGQRLLETYDYDGQALTIRLDPEKTALENAQDYFEKAKKAKGRIGLVSDQIQRLSTDRTAIESVLARLEGVTRLDEIEELAAEAAKRRWLHVQTHKDKPDERPYEGHRIRELVGPGGYRVLYGENATSNDYLTMRVAKPNDWWLHVRGSVSAHVVILTGKQPEKVQRETMLFAAKVAVANSPSKHSGFVPVDYTLRKFVRKPKGAPAGTALYTHEKTLHVDGTM